MSRITILLLVLAFGLALFLMTNAEAREQAQTAWVEFYARISPSFEGLFSGGDAGASMQDNTSADSTESGTSAIGSLSLTALVESLREVFVSFASRLQLAFS
jgi:hypothetical protein